MLFSIITVCFNSAKTIRETFDSVLSQSCKDYEYLVIDGASTDGTLDIIKGYEPKCDGRMHWISEPDNGIYDAVRKGFAMAKGDVFAWIGSDDVYMPNAFANIKKVFESYPEVQWATGEQCHILDDGTLCNANYSRKFTYRDFCLKTAFWVQQESTFWRKELWEKCNDSFGNYRYAGDYSLWLHFSKHTQLYTLPLLLAAFHLRAGQTSQVHMAEYMAEVDDICKNEFSIMSPFQRFTLRLYTWLRGKRVLRRIAHRMEKHWDNNMKSLIFNSQQRTVELR